MSLFNTIIEGFDFRFRERGKKGLRLIVRLDLVVLGKTVREI